MHSKGIYREQEWVCVMFHVIFFFPRFFLLYKQWSIDDSSADLITVNQGLHHFPQCEVIPFLGEVYRILRPGGLLIVREHDASEQLIPLLDLAHSVFNAIVGVDKVAESQEIRAFRPILEWRYEKKKEKKKEKEERGKRKN